MSLREALYFRISVALANCYGLAFGYWRATRGPDTEMLQVVTALALTVAANAISMHLSRVALEFDTQ